MSQRLGPMQLRVPSYAVTIPVASLATVVSLALCAGANAVSTGYPGSITVDRVPNSIRLSNVLIWDAGRGCGALIRELEDPMAYWLLFHRGAF
jgi:hypothetical protein